MSIRAIWIIGTLPENYGKVLFCRKFPVVEKRAQTALGECYVSSPSDSDFSTDLLLSLGFLPKSQFIPWRDSVLKDTQLPVTTIKMKGKDLWPIVMLQKYSCVLCCLPFVENYQNDLPVSSITVGLCLLTQILHFLGPDTLYIDELCEQFQELNNYLSLSMPLGTPTETDFKKIVASHNESSSPSVKTNTANTFPYSYKGKPSILIEVCEYVRSSQWDSRVFQPVVEVYGNIDVKLDTPSHINELSLSLDHSVVGSSLSLKSIGINPCVQILTCAGGSSMPKRLWVMPTLQYFTLCSYSAAYETPPITGIYKMKESLPVELLIQLKLSEDVKNNFNLCEVYIPFFNCGLISNFEFKANQGFLNISKDKQALKWNIGSKFPMKTLEVMLTAKIQFCTDKSDANAESFSMGKNAYVQVNFRKSFENFSGCTIDPKTVVVSPPQKTKVFINCAVQSSEYVIWNSFGDVPFPVIPKHLILKE